MRFGVPLGLLWFLAWGVVLLLYFLQRRLRREEVSALFLWERIPELSLSFRERLQMLWEPILFLQLLAVGLLGVAFAEPLLWREMPTGSAALILDGSASMWVEGRPAEVRALAARIVRAARGPWAVVLWADPPRYLAPPTRNRAEALRGIAQYAPTYGKRCPLGEALAFIPGEWDRVVVITDSPPPGAHGLEVIPLPRAEDLALTAFSVRPLPQGTGYEAFVAVRNMTGRAQEVPVVVRAGTYTFRERLEIPPGEERGLSFPYFGPTDLGFTAEIGTDDSFPLDDKRFFSFGFRVIRVRWAGEEDRFLRAALRAAGPISFVDSPPWDLTVAVRTELAGIDGPTLLWESSTPGIRLGEPVGTGDWEAPDGALAQSLDLSRWEGVKIHPVALPEGADVLLRRGGFPAAFTISTPMGPVAVCALSFAGAKEVLLSPDFPLFVRRLISALLPPLPGGTHEVGEAISLPPGAAVILGGEEITGSWIPQAPGLYRGKTGEGAEFWVAVNLPYGEIVPLESGGTHVASPREGTVAPAEAELPLWRAWAWGLLLVLLAEGALALRRW